MTKQQREEYEQKLARVISDVLARDDGMRMEAVLFGRTGLTDMSDTTLLELGEEVWRVPFNQVQDH